MEKVKGSIKLIDFREDLKEDLIDVLMDAYRELPEYGEKNRKGAKRYINWLKKHSTFFKIIKIDGEVAGFIVADANWIDINRENVGEIHELAIKRKFWGMGVGDSVLEKVLKHFREKGLKKAGLWVGRKNKRAIEFYKKHDFKETGISYHDWLRMERNL